MRSNDSSPHKGKAKLEIRSDAESIPEDVVEKFEGSDGWDEDEMELAFNKSRYAHNCIFVKEQPLRTVFSTSNDDHDRVEGSKSTSYGRAEGSKSTIRGQDLIEDPFAVVSSKNVMPTPPSKSKKYLEDYEDLIIKYALVVCTAMWLMSFSRSLPNEDGSFFANVQDPLLRNQYKNLPPLR